MFYIQIYNSSTMKLILLLIEAVLIFAMFGITGIIQKRGQAADEDPKVTYNKMRVVRIIVAIICLVILYFYIKSKTY